MNMFQAIQDGIKTKLAERPYEFVNNDFFPLRLAGFGLPCEEMEDYDPVVCVPVTVEEWSNELGMLKEKK